MRTWLYCSDEPEGRIFEGAAIQKALASGWVDSPKRIKDTAAPDERQELLAMASDLGLKVDMRWGLSRLRDEIERATKP